MEEIVTEQTLVTVAAGLCAPWPEADPVAVATQKAAPRRRAVLDARRALLNQLEWRTAREIRAALRSTSLSPWRRALRLRNGNRLLGVKYGRHWKYPAFQFDADGRIRPEIAVILPRLPDVSGWIRLRWFLTPNAHFGGQTPMSVWRHDPARVARAIGCEEDESGS